MNPCFLPVKKMKKLGRKMKIELVAAIIMTVALSSFTAYVNRPQESSWESFSGESAEARSAHREALQSTWGLGVSEVQQVITENVQGELRKGTFETVIKGLKNVTSSYEGRIPYLKMLYENEIWTGTLNCKIPTANVDSFTFDARRLIDKHGKVTHISISVTETIVNETQYTEEPLSDVSINLHENAGGTDLSFLSQVGAVVPWLVTSLVWVVQGLIIGLPLCFVSLGIVMIVNRGIIPIWKKQFKSKSLSQPG
jgi:hypothetical protein